MRPLSVGLRLPRDGDVAEALEATVRRLNEEAPPKGRTSADKLLLAALEDPEVASSVVSYLEGLEDSRATVADSLEKEATRIEAEAAERAQHLRDQAAEARKEPSEEEGE